jgi:glycosyltransferase involved in cell wall biosynthesis
MKVIGFVEGARAETGGFGLIGVPWIHQSFANRGYHDVLIIAGKAIPSAEPFLRRNVEEIYRASSAALFAAVTYQARGRWQLAPTLMRDLNRYVPKADFITLHSLYSFPVLAGYLLARRHHKPYGLWPHGVLSPFQRKVHWRRKWLYDRIIAWRILKEAKVLFFSAVGEREEVHHLNLTTPSVIIPHGIDMREYINLPPRGHFRNRYLGGHAGPMVLYLGRLNAKKGLDLLVEAMAKVFPKMPNVRLGIVGGADPPRFTHQLNKQLERLHITDRTILTGPLSGQEKLEAFADADVFVMPSHAENFSFAMFEAMASRIPVVISNTLNFAHDVERYSAGIIVDRDPISFANAIVHLLQETEDSRHQIGENGRNLAHNFSWEACAEKMEKTIQCILERKPLPAELTLDK